jgi:hypothetical protein
VARPHRKLTRNSADWFRHRAGLAWVRGDEATALYLEHQALLRDKFLRMKSRIEIRVPTKLMEHAPIK